MARVNVEPELFQDRRFQKLMIRLGSTETAVGTVVLAWMVGQKFWVHSDNGIPKTEWIKQDLKQELIEVGLAEDKGEFVRIVGSEKHFNWIRKKVEAGKKGGLTRKKPKLEIIEEKAKHNEAHAKLLQASSLSSLSSKEEKNIIIGAESIASLKAGIAEAYAIWSETLRTFGVPVAEMSQLQEAALARAIRHLGLQDVLLALEGKRYEKGNEKYDPRSYLSVDRVLHRDKNGRTRCEEFKNMALAARAKAEAERKGREEAEATP